MKVGMKKEDMDVADEMTLPNLVSRSMRDCTHSDDIHNGIMPKRTYQQFMVLEGKDCDENVHEGGHGRCG